MRSAYCFLAVLFCSSAVFAAAEKSALFPPDVVETNDFYADWYGPELERLNEKPIWNDAAESEIVRFTFLRGASLVRGVNSIVIRIQKSKDGGATLLAKRRYIDQGSSEIQTIRRIRLATTQVEKLDMLARQADLWRYRSGTWMEKDDDIYIHCTELIMERASGSEYSVSHNLVSCNQPIRLMPLVDYVAELAKLRPDQLFYSSGKKAPMP